MSDPVPSEEESTSRTQIIRDVLIFQAKLWLEGFKDFVLMPLSMGAAVIDVVFRGSGRGTLYSVMRLGDRFERWVHLYAALEDDPAEKTPEANLRTLDHLLNEAADGVEQNVASSHTEGPEASRSKS
jgi:hypothetical protein